MIAVAFLLILAAGVPAAFLLGGDRDRRLLLGEGFLIGCAIAAGLLLALSLCGIAWRPVLVVLLMVALSALGWSAVRRRGFSLERPERQGLRWLAAILDLVTLAVVVGYGLLTTAAPQSESDFLTIWGYKARVFLHAGGVDWGFLRNPLSIACRPDYPIFLPLSIDFLNVLQGSWDDRLIGWLYAGFGAAVLLVVRALLAEELRSEVAAALGTLTLASFAVTPWMGLAEGPMIAFGTAGMLLARRDLVEKQDRSLGLAAVLLGVVAFTKNEGMALVFCATVGIALFGGRKVLRMWPAWAIGAVWIVIRWWMQLSTPLLAGSLAERAAYNLRQGAVLVRSIVSQPTGQPLFWIGVVVVMVACIHELGRRDGVILVTAFLQLLTFLGAYIVTPYGLSWHVRWSWERLAFEVTLLVGYCAVRAALEALLEDRRVAASGAG